MRINSACLYYLRIEFVTLFGLGVDLSRCDDVYQATLPLARPLFLHVGHRPLYRGKQGGCDRTQASVRYKGVISGLLFYRIYSLIRRMYNGISR